MNIVTIPEIEERISTLYNVAKGKQRPEDIARSINDVLIFGDNISPNLLSQAWELFAKRKGVFTK